MSVIQLARIGSDKPELYACPKCGALSSPRIYLAREEVAHRAAIEMAERCCAPRACEDCGGEVPKHFTVCAPCRERRKLRKAERVTWDGDCMVCRDDTFAGSPEELPEGTVWCHPCTYEPFVLDMENLLERARDEHHEDILTEIDGEELRAIEGAIDAFNKAGLGGSWHPDTKRVIVLDERAFAGLLDLAKPKP